MKLHELFPEISLNPASSKDIKQWILQLAVEGKLTKKWREENLYTESAFNLIDKMNSELKQLIKNKQVKKEKELDPINDFNIEIPDSWAPVRLGIIGDWGAGATPLRSVSVYYDGEINWYKSGELNNGIIDYPSEEKITEEALKKCSLRMNKPGDVLIAMYGATIGKTGLLQTFGTTNQAVCGCTPYSGITSSFLILLLNGYKTVFIDQGEGGAQPNISRIKIRNQVILLPPLEEQQAIVSIVEELFKEVDALAQQATKCIDLKRSYAQVALQRLCDVDTKSEWRQLVSVFPEIFNDKQTIKTLRETILQLAVQGKLTEKWRSEIPSNSHASELLDQIKAEKLQLIKAKKIKAEKPLPKIEADEIPFDLPESWVWCRWIDVCSVIGDVDHKMPVEQKEGIPYISPRDFEGKHSINFERSKKISLEDYNTLSKKIKPERNDLIFPRYGTIGVNRLVDFDLDFLVSYSCAIMKQNVKIIDPKYGFLVSISRITKLEIEKYVNKTTQPNVGIASLKLFLFPLPSLSEQQLIVGKVNALMGLCDELEKGVENKQKLLNAMN
jgi:type I restriction enzyme S subunit